MYKKALINKSMLNAKRKALPLPSDPQFKIETSESKSSQTSMRSFKKLTAKMLKSTELKADDNSSSDLTVNDSVAPSVHTQPSVDSDFNSEQFLKNCGQAQQDSQPIDATNNSTEQDLSKNNCCNSPINNQPKLQKKSKDIGLKRNRESVENIASDYLSATNLALYETMLIQSELKAKQRREQKQKDKLAKRLEQTLAKDKDLLETKQKVVKNTEHSINQASQTEALDIVNILPRATQLANKLRKQMMITQKNITNQNRNLREETRKIAKGTEALFFIVQNLQKVMEDDN